MRTWMGARLRSTFFWTNVLFATVDIAAYGKDQCPRLLKEMADNLGVNRPMRLMTRTKPIFWEVKCS